MRTRRIDRENRDRSVPKPIRSARYLAATERLACRAFGVCLTILLAMTLAAPSAVAGQSVGERRQQPPTIGCGDEVAYSDSNGRWQLRFQCFPAYGVINWDYTLSRKNRSIAASWVSEDGLRWWRNGGRQPKNSPHFAPPDYRFHGTMARVFVGDIIDYQDYLTFRHNIGPGGTAALTFAGSVRLVH